MSESSTGTEQDKLERVVVPAMEALLGRRFPVLDQGFVRVVDYMGSDASIVQAARVSYGKGTKQVHQDRGLIRYLMRHRHTTPFEMWRGPGAGPQGPATLDLHRSLLEN